MEVPMHSTRLTTRALVAIVFAPLCTLAACHSGRGANAPPVNRTAGDTSSVATGDGKSIETLLEGRFPGVSVSPANGGIQVRIRGGSNSFYGGEEPLYVLDDVPLPSGTGGIIMVNPYDIQRIEVLKNPADIAIYGIRGANGVVKITTKKRGR
jgi:TonB-dependent SusC/RagA subfamily outer membrane receptor